MSDVGVNPFSRYASRDIALEVEETRGMAGDVRDGQIPSDGGGLFAIEDRSGWLWRVNRLE